MQVFKECADEKGGDDYEMLKCTTETLLKMTLKMYLNCKCCRFNIQYAFDYQYIKVNLR